MKVAIITIHRVLNYGTVLQAFATQELIKSLGFKVKIIDYITEIRTFRKVFFWYPEDIKDTVFNKIVYIASRLPANILKHIIFNRFIRKNYQLTDKKYYSIADLKKNPPEADIYVVGSDQVWNSKYNQMVDKGFFLDFGDASTKKISFSSSFGVDNLEKKESRIIKQLLSNFDAISVREDVGVQILNEIGYNAKLVLDPTLILNKETWLKYVKKKKIKGKYVLLFLLYNEDNGATRYARKIADEKGLEVIQLYWKPLRRRGVDRIAIYKSPFEFLRYFRDARYIVTNSFHGTAFAINFNKQFITVARSEFNSRLESTLKLCGLKERYITTDFDVSRVLKEIDYFSVNKILYRERESSMNYLKQALFK